jgi:hypothetical protein
MTMVENDDYVLVPVEESSNDQAWEVRILNGPFVETMLRFGNIAFDPDEDCLKFNFNVSFTPSVGIDENDANLQQVAGAILEDVIAKGIETGSLDYKERD